MSSQLALGNRRTCIAAKGMRSPIALKARYAKGLSSACKAKQASTFVITALLSPRHTVGTIVNNGSAAALHALTEQHANNEDQSAWQYDWLTLVPRCIALVCESCFHNLHDPDNEIFGSLSLLHVLLCSLAQIDRHT